MKIWDVTIRIPLPDDVPPPEVQGWAAVDWLGSDDMESAEGVTTAVRGVDQLQAEGITVPAFKVRM